MQKRVLVLDSDAVSRQFMADLFLSEDYEVRTIEFTNNVIREFNDYAPDVLLLDYILNGINGDEICRQVKANPHTCHVPVIMVSAYPGSINSSGNYGCDHFIAKPFEIDDMLNQVKRLMKIDDKQLQI